MILFKILISFLYIYYTVNGFHIGLIKNDYIVLDGVKISPNDLHNQLEHHEKILLFGNESHHPNINFLHVKHIDQHKRTKRSTQGLISLQLDDNSKNISIKLKQSPKLIDDSFILIRRYENSSKFIENSHKLASNYEKCFYQNENSALDLCDETIRGLFHHNTTDYIIHPLPSRFGDNSHIFYEKVQKNLHSTLKSSKISENDKYEELKSEPEPVNDIFFEPNIDGFNDMNLNDHKSILRNEKNVNKLKEVVEENDHRINLNTTNYEFLKNNKDHSKNDVDNSKHNNYNNKNDNINDDLRIKRHISTQWKIPQVLHIETAIFVDKDLYKHMARNFPKNTENHLIRFVLAMINGVQLLYHHPSLGHQINFVLKRLEILHNDPQELRRSSDIDVFLNNFCMWQRKLNPTSDADVVHYDHAVILTGLDLYVVGKNGKLSSQVVGLAPVAGMCTSTSSCTINEGKHFESVFVVAHEIGHNLGMRHDTSDNSCDPSLYIMSPTLGSGKITWSKCSRSYLNSFLETPQAQCMFDRGQFGNSLDHAAEGILPGERFDADQQCMLKYGTDSVRSRTQPLNDICRDLHCQRERYTWTSHPALEGTDCGEMMWCRSGICILKAALMESIHSIPKEITITKQMDKVNFIDDKKFGNLRHEYNFNKPPTWSDWSEPTDCDSGCLYGASGRLREGSTGLKTFIRNCLDYRKRCNGRERKYESCIAKQCYTITKTTIEEFATQICERAKKFDNELIGEGLQHVGETVEESCKVFCKTKTNGTKSRSWTFPDGTTCQTKIYDFDDTAYCINGRCEKFSCENSTSNYFKIDTTFCPQNSLQENQNNLNNGGGRNLKSVHIRNRIENESSVGRNFHHGTNGFIRKSDTNNNYQPWKLLTSENTRSEKIIENIWTVKSGCHFSCMNKAKGIQVVISKLDGTNNIQLCSPNIMPCDRLQTINEFAENICTRYKLKVRGLSGYGMQIAPSVQDPDRSCKVACQDELLQHRFYLVNGDHGLFPFGTKCSPREERYCVNGKCLEFGRDDIPLTRSYISLALFRSKRDTSKRNRRSYLYYQPINITENISQAFLDTIIRNLNFNIRDHSIANEQIEFNNPIHISFEELI